MNMKKLESILEEDGIVFLTYGGLITQNLIAGMTDALEKESEQGSLDYKISSDIFTIFIELSQNMMNYSRVIKENDPSFDSKGLIMVGRSNPSEYYVLSQNIINKEDRLKLLPKLEEIISLDKNELRTRYKELRKNGQNLHGRGAGIGFYEIAKRCAEIKFSFNQINDEKFYFVFRAIIHINEGEKNGKIIS